MIHALHFLRPLWLLAIVPAVLLWARSRGRTAGLEGWAAHIAPGLLEHLRVDREGRRRIGPLDLLALGAVLASIGMAGPAWSLRESPDAPDATPMVLVLELSESMAATDIGPSRFERGKLKLLDLLAARGKGRAALLAYAGTGHVAMPLTDDPSVIPPYLRALSPDVMPEDGDAPASLAPALDATLGASDQPATVVWVTDGVSPNTKPVSEVLAKHHASLVIWAVGTPAGGLDRSSLSRFAAETGGDVQALRLGDGDTQHVLAVLQQARLAAARPDADQWKDSGRLLVFPLVLVLLWWWRRGFVVHLFLLGLVVLPGCQSPLLWTPDQRGQRLFDAGEYAAAADTFSDPLRRGLSAYAAEDWARAITELSGVDSVEGRFALGNALAQGGKIQSAISAYDAVLAEDPTHKGAHANRYVMQKLLGSLAESDDTDVQAKREMENTDDAVTKLDRDQVSKEHRPAESKAPISEASWLERVDTPPDAFLRGKFAIQAREAR